MKGLLFQDKTLQDQFERDGFLIAPFLSTDEVAQLQDHYQLNFSERPSHFYSSTFIEDAERKRSIHQPIQQLLQPKVNQLFTAHQALGSSYLVKPPGGAGKMQVHQDWTVVDEKRFCSLTVWVPLVDTTPDNGAIRVLPGSHRFFQQPRGPSIPVPYESLYEKIWPQMKVLKMKAGQAFIFDQALIHASNENHTDQDRIAVTYGLIPEEAQLRFYHLNEAKKVEEYEVATTFFQNYTTIGQRPTNGKLVAEHSINLASVSEAVLQQKINQSKKMNPIFQDPGMQDEFEQQGYTVKRVFSSEQVEELLDYFHSLPLKDQTGYGFYVSMDDPQREMVNAITDTLFEKAIPKVMPHFKAAKPFTAAFVTKDPNPQGVVPVHQDWTFVDQEGVYYSVNCWVPLVDVTLENGALGVIKGSHRFLTDVRPSPSPQVVSPLRDHMFSLFPYVQLVELKAGEAIFFDNRTFHASPPNVTDEQRIVIGMGFTHEDAQLCHYYMKPDGKQQELLKYHIDTAFFRKYNNALLCQMYDAGKIIEDYPLVEKLPYQPLQLDTDKLIEQVKAAGNTMNLPLIEKLAKLFNYNMDGSKKTSHNQAATSQQAAPPTPDERSFWQIYTLRNILKEVRYRLFDVYTPMNILREIRYRLTGK
ncbi:MAG TPA: phytanoyl-CoA dioxygenase family protein [Saprospiraceae bacterium]|nr:phytanoyl-CoA dioxygenase family protein [Saprospiraceae bacterium]